MCLQSTIYLVDIKGFCLIVFISWETILSGFVFSIRCHGLGMRVLLIVMATHVFGIRCHVFGIRVLLIGIQCFAHGL